MFSNLFDPSNILLMHFFISLILGFIAAKYLDRNFLLWFVISFLVPVLSIIILLILGFDGNYCPNCLKKIKKSHKICPHCNFDIDKYYAINNLNKEKSLRKIKERKNFKKNP